jgi:hypothetical protein
MFEIARDGMRNFEEMFNRERWTAGQSGDTPSLGGKIVPFGSIVLPPGKTYDFRFLKVTSLASASACPLSTSYARSLVLVRTGQLNNNAP